MTDELEDRRLVKRLLAHDREAFTAFFDGYFPRLYRFARARLGDDPDTTKEIVQVTLTKAIRKLASYRGEAAFFTWLCTICRHEIADYRERVARERQHVVLTEDTPDIRAAVEAIAAPESDDPEHNFRRLETTRLIQVALDQLPTHYGDALEWKYVYGFSVDEIAAKLGIGFEAAQSLLARAKRAFQEIYGALTVELRSNPGRNSPKTAAETP
jgi:RNA polymerase sigma-70 factor (ECF subfamily)